MKRQDDSSIRHVGILKSAFGAMSENGIGTESVRVLDGGFGTYLESLGHSFQNEPLWSCRFLHTNINTVKEAHLAFLQSGSDVIETNTYQASIDGFSKHLGITENQSILLMKKACETAIDARNEFWSSCTPGLKRSRPLVAGSVGPYGACQADGSEYSGLYVDSMTEKDLMDWHRPRITALTDAGVDILAVETIPAMKEAAAVCALLSTEFPRTTAWLSFSCKDNLHLCHGESFEDAVRSIAHCSNLVAVGVNCVNPSDVTALLVSAQNVVPANLSFVVYPNSGEIWKNDNGLGYWTGCANDVPMETYVNEWLRKGAKWIGGCCRVLPAEIAKMRKTVLEYNACLNKQQ